MKYRKKPVVIEAVQVERKYFDLLEEFVPEEIRGDYGSGEFYEDTCFMEIKTLEGTMTANEGDYVIKGIKGEFYACKPDIFEMTYEKIEDFAL